MTTTSYGSIASGSASGRVFSSENKSGVVWDRYNERIVVGAKERTIRRVFGITTLTRLD